jgi:hypothetical protein
MRSAAGILWPSSARMMRMLFVEPVRSMARKSSRAAT